MRSNKTFFLKKIYNPETGHKVEPIGQYKEDVIFDSGKWQIKPNVKQMNNESVSQETPVEELQKK